MWDEGGPQGCLIAECSSLRLWTLKPSHDPHGYELLDILNALEEWVLSRRALPPCLCCLLLQGVLTVLCTLLGAWASSSLAPRAVLRWVWISYLTSGCVLALGH